MTQDLVRMRLLEEEIEALRARLGVAARAGDHGLSSSTIRDLSQELDRLIRTYLNGAAVGG